MKIMDVIRNRACLVAALFMASTVACFAQWTQHESHFACEGSPCCCYNCGGYEACGPSSAWSDGWCAAFCTEDCGTLVAYCWM